MERNVTIDENLIKEKLAPRKTSIDVKSFEISKKKLI